MCKGVNICTELGSDSNNWSKVCPLPPPPFFQIALDYFSLSVRELVNGNRDKALEALKKSNSDLVGEFFIKHGQQSSYFRVLDRNAIDKENRAKKEINQDQRLNANLENEVFLRDSYRCRYCEMRIISKDVFAQYARVVGQEVFSTERANSKRNGLTLGLRGVADHVQPFAGGGKTDTENLVTSCYSCNFGKAGYTLQQIGIDDPRIRLPVKDDWKGLTEFLPALKKIS